MIRPIDDETLTHAVRWADTYRALPRHQKTPALLEKAEIILRMAARIRRSEDALASLGVMPDGYCFCFNGDRDPTKPYDHHTGECQQAREALEA